ncbi:MAG: SBBP repeat-containing protein, partial [Gammaproteobacteria bacterium]
VHPTSGDVYVAGDTDSTNFPNTAGGAQAAAGGNGDAFVARLNAALTSLIQATYLGGSEFEQGGGLAIHPTSGDVYVAGSTDSADFPNTTGGAQAAAGGNGDAFVARLNVGLTVLTQATYLGGSDSETGRGLAIHPTSGDIYVAGSTDSADFPNTTGGAQAAAAGDGDAFVALLNAALTSLTRATYLGGSGNETSSALAIHPTSGDIYVVGFTSSTDFPATAGGFQPSLPGIASAFAARFNPALTALPQATYLGGTFFDIAFAVAIHPTSGEVYVAGFTISSDFPGTTHGAQPTLTGGALGLDAFTARLGASLTSLEQATYLGGSDADFGLALAIHPTSGQVYVAGLTDSADFPGTTGGAQPTYGGNTDGFVARLTADLAGPPDLTILKAHGGTFAQGQIGASYIILVSHLGGTVTSGTVTVTDTLPAGLTATALSGVGWSCALGTLTCTRSDALSAGASYPTITLTVNVASDAPPVLVNTATVAGGGDVTPANNTATDVT